MIKAIIFYRELQNVAGGYYRCPAHGPYIPYMRIIVGK